MTAPTAPPFNAGNVLVGAAALYLAPKGTPMPADSSTLFDPTNWTGKTLSANGATAVTLTVTNSLGTASTASLATFSTITAAQVQSALQGLANVGTDPSTGVARVKVTGAVAGGPFVVVFDNALGATTLSISASTGGAGPTISGGLWTPPGATEAGWTFGAAKNTNTIRIEEQSTAAGKYISDQTLQISGNLAEDTQANWQFAMNAVKTIIAAASGVAGVTVLTLTDELTHYAVALESKNEFGFASRKYIPDSVCAEALSVVYRRASAQRMLNVSFEAVCPINQIVSRAVTAAALP